MRPDDAEAVLAIYKIGMDEGNATFETELPTWEQFRASRLPTCSHVAMDGTDNVLGWVAASHVSTRRCYAGVVEHSVYVHPAARGRRIGRLLLNRLVDACESLDIWTIQSSIFPENHASLALHTAAGFRTIGTRERIAQQRGVWRDTVLVERRRHD